MIKIGSKVRLTTKYFGYSGILEKKQEGIVLTYNDSQNIYTVKFFIENNEDFCLERIDAEWLEEVNLNTTLLEDLINEV